MEFVVLWLGLMCFVGASVLLSEVIADYFKRISK